MAVAWTVLILVGLLVYIYLGKMRASHIYENRGKFIGFAAVVAALIFVLYVSTTYDVKRNYKGEVVVESNEVYQYPFFYGIMFDAGSTGSRIHVYQFQYVAKGKPYKLISELFKQTKPGLSSYASMPQLGADSLIHMLDEAKNIIPAEQWAITPIELKATAGLRLLGEKQSSTILNKVKELFRRYPFNMGNNSVSIMGGTDEGGLISKTMMSGMIDLGGGSVQLAFVPTSTKTLEAAPARFLKDIKIFSENYKLYTHSYLGLGLMTARFKMLGGKEDDENPDRLKSSCFPDDFMGEYIHPSKKTYKVSGITSDSSFESCYKSAKIAVESFNIHKTTEVKQLNFILMSYFYDNAVLANLISQTSDEATIMIKRYKEAAKQECDMAQRLADFLCMDLSYIAALLEEGFGFPPGAEVKVVKKIKGTEISWALGATFSMLNSQSSPNSMAAGA